MSSVFIYKSAVRTYRVIRYNGGESFDLLYTGSYGSLGSSPFCFAINDDEQIFYANESNGNRIACRNVSDGSLVSFSGWHGFGTQKILLVDYYGKLWTCQNAGGRVFRKWEADLSSCETYTLGAGVLSGSSFLRCGMSYDMEYFYIVSINDPQTLCRVKKANLNGGSADWEVTLDWGGQDAMSVLCDVVSCKDGNILVSGQWWDGFETFKLSGSSGAVIWGRDSIFRGMVESFNWHDNLCVGRYTPSNVADPYYGYWKGTLVDSSSGVLLYSTEWYADNLNSITVLDDDVIYCGSTLGSSSPVRVFDTDWVDGEVPIAQYILFPNSYVASTGDPCGRFNRYCAPVYTDIIVNRKSTGLQLSKPLVNVDVLGETCVATSKGDNGAATVVSGVKVMAKRKLYFHGVDVDGYVPELTDLRSKKSVSIEVSKGRVVEADSDGNPTIDVRSETDVITEI